MIKLLSAILIVSTLSGCTPADQVDKAQMDFVCKQNQGVFKYALYLGALTSKVRCNNGKYVMWHTVVIPKEGYND